MSGRGRPDSLGENRLAGCDFSTAVLDDVAFIAIDFRLCTPPDSPRVVVLDHFLERCRKALSALQGMSGPDARAAEAVLRIEGDEVHLLPTDAVGILDLGSYPGGLHDAITTAFGLVV